MPIGDARVARAGRDATVVTYGVGGAVGARRGGVRSCRARWDREIEVIDLRSLLPWDIETVMESVQAHRARAGAARSAVTGGFGGEVAATIGREAFEWLDAPVARLGALDTPIPFSKALEEIFSPKSKLLPALRDLLAY